MRGFTVCIPIQYIFIPIEDPYFHNFSAVFLMSDGVVTQGGGVLYRCTGSRTDISHPMLDKHLIIYMTCQRNPGKGGINFCIFRSACKLVSLRSVVFV